MKMVDDVGVEITSAIEYTCHWDETWVQTESLGTCECVYYQETSHLILYTFCAFCPCQL